MTREELYPNIRYFLLAKPLPLCEVGTNVLFARNDSRDWLQVNGLELSIHAAIEAPDWFIPVTNEEHRKICYDNFISYAEKRGRSTEEAQELWRILGTRKKMTVSKIQKLSTESG